MLTKQHLVTLRPVMRAAAAVRIPQFTQRCFTSLLKARPALPSPALGSLSLRSPTRALPVQQSRSLFHIPFLALGGKVLALLTLKKLAVMGLVAYFGIEKTFAFFRSINDSLLFVNKGYTKSMHETVAQGLQLLEASMTSVRDSDRAAKVWEWFKNIDKAVPMFSSEVLKSWVQKFAPSQFASGAAEAQEGVTVDADVKTEVDEIPRDEGIPEEEWKKIVKSLEAQHPKLSEYHLLLIRKDKTVNA